MKLSHLLSANARACIQDFTSKTELLLRQYKIEKGKLLALSERLEEDGQTVCLLELMLHISDMEMSLLTSARNRLKTLSSQRTTGESNLAMARESIEFECHVAIKMIAGIVVPDFETQVDSSAHDELEKTAAKRKIRQTFKEAFQNGNFVGETLRFATCLLQHEDLFDPFLESTKSPLR